jgi:hypothetical protein
MSIQNKRYVFDEPIKWTDDVTTWYDPAADEMVVDNGVGVYRGRPKADPAVSDYTPVIAWNDGLQVGNHRIYGIGFSKSTGDLCVLNQEKGNGLVLKDLDANKDDLKSA